MPEKRVGSNTIAGARRALRRRTVGRSSLHGKASVVPYTHAAGMPFDTKRTPNANAHRKRPLVQGIADESAVQDPGPLKNMALAPLSMLLSRGLATWPTVTPSKSPNRLRAGATSSRNVAGCPGLRCCADMSNPTSTLRRIAPAEHTGVGTSGTGCPPR